VAADAPRIRRVEVSAFTVPTDFPEADGTLDWDRTTLVVVEVEAEAGAMRGLGYTYADTATAVLIRDRLAELVAGRSAFDVPGVWRPRWPSCPTPRRMAANQHDVGAARGDEQPDACERERPRPVPEGEDHEAGGRDTGQDQGRHMAVAAPS
jgi:hypothetical protein